MNSKLPYRNSVLLFFFFMFSLVYLTNGITESFHQKNKTNNQIS